MATITVSPETNAQIKQYAQETGRSNDEAAEKLIDIAIGRLSAIRKDAKRRAAGKPTTHRQVTVKVIDREKPAKAKAPKARKPKAKAQEASA